MITIAFNGTVYTCPLLERQPRASAKVRERVTADPSSSPVFLYFDSTLGLEDCVLQGAEVLVALAECGDSTKPVFKWAGSLTTDEARARAAALNSPPAPQSRVTAVATVTPSDPSALSPIESARLVDLERLVERFRSSFIEAGEALREIRDGRLYRTSHGTFDEYAKVRWSLTRSQAHRLIAATDIVAIIRMSPIGDILPVTESQARELIRLDNPEQQVAAWGNAVERADSDPRRITAKIVKEEVDKLLPEKPEEPGFVLAEEREAIRKFLAARLARWPDEHKPKFAPAVTELLVQLGVATAPEPPAPDQPVAQPVEADQPAPDDGPHPYNQLRRRVIQLQKDIKAELNASSPDASRLVEVMSLARVLRHPGSSGGPIEFLPTLGIPILLSIAADPEHKLTELKVTQKYLAATGSWVPPWVELQRQKRKRRAAE